jgi:pseudouridine-5'-phosphate glycosidase
VPATVAVLDGVLRVGLADTDLERIASSAVKVSSRDIGPAIVDHATGATTVAASVRAAAIAGIRFFATGGIGGVHRGHPEDVSADLEEIARSPVAVCQSLCWATRPTSSRRSTRGAAGAA